VSSRKLEGRIANGADIDATGDVDVRAVSHVSQRSEANSAAFGLVGAGASILTSGASINIPRGTIVETTLSAPLTLTL
jgi:hypothetical protein